MVWWCCAQHTTIMNIKKFSLSLHENKMWPYYSLICAQMKCNMICYILLFWAMTPYTLEWHGSITLSDFATDWFACQIPLTVMGFACGMFTLTHTSVLIWWCHQFLHLLCSLKMHLAYFKKKNTVSKVQYKQWYYKIWLKYAYSVLIGL